VPRQPIVASRSKRNLPHTARSLSLFVHTPLPLLLLPPTRLPPSFITLDTAVQSISNRSLNQFNYLDRLRPTTRVTGGATINCLVRLSTRTSLVQVRPRQFVCQTTMIRSAVLPVTTVPRLTNVTLVDQDTFLSRRIAVSNLNPIRPSRRSRSAGQPRFASTSFVHLDHRHHHYHHHQQQQLQPESTCRSRSHVPLLALFLPIFSPISLT
jgi:hypothetical protein